jgi:hypothetical protein
MVLSRMASMWRYCLWRNKGVPFTPLYYAQIRLGFTLLTSSRTNQDALSMLPSYCITVWQYDEREDISTVTWALTSKEWNLIGTVIVYWSTSTCEERQCTRLDHFVTPQTPDSWAGSRTLTLVSVYSTQFCYRASYYSGTSWVKIAKCRRSPKMCHARRT